MTRSTLGYPIIEAFLADLGEMLYRVDADDREEVVQSVREHIEARLSELPGEPTPADLAEILTDVGSVDEIASAASTSDAHVDDRPPRDSRLYAGIGVVVGVIAAAVTIIAAPLGLALAIINLVVCVLMAWRARFTSSHRAWLTAAIVAAVGLLVSVAWLVLVLLPLGGTASTPGPAVPLSQ